MKENNAITRLDVRHVSLILLLPVNDASARGPSYVLDRAWKGMI